MKNIRKYTLTGISALLLLCFSVTVLPADFFHRHNAGNKLNQVCKSAKGENCKHKNHLSSPNNFCWVCAIHFDKSFSTEVQVQESKPRAWKIVTFNFVYSGSEDGDKETNLLRGPPAA